MVKETPYLNSWAISVTQSEQGPALLHLTFLCPSREDEIQMRAKPVLAGLGGSSSSLTNKGYAPRTGPSINTKAELTFIEVAENLTLNVANVGLEVTSPRICLASQ